MTTRLLDANVLLRHLLADHPVQSPACLALIQEIERGNLVAWATDLVIAEVAFVLSSRSRYGFSPEAIREMLLPLIRLPGLRVARKQLYERIFDIYVDHRIDFIDAYHAALAEHEGDVEIGSYGRHFDRIPGIRRVEP